LDETQTKVLRDFLLAVHNHLYSFALRFVFLQTHATSYSFYVQLLYTVKKIGEKLDRKPYPLPYGLRNPYRNLKSENSQDYAQKPVLRIRNKSFGSDFGSESGLKLVSDLDPDLYLDPNPDPKRLFRFRIGSSQKFRILLDPDPQHCQKSQRNFTFMKSDSDHENIPYCGERKIREPYVKESATCI
jgi:hypothetical protein